MGDRAPQEAISQTMMANLPFLAGLGLNGHTLAAAGAIALASAATLSILPTGRIWSLNTRVDIASRGSAGTAWRRLGSKLLVLDLPPP
jgi:hypothetical protein